jgi:hypothetical protein
LSFKLMVALPCHSGSFVAETTRSLLSLQELMLERGGSLLFHYRGGAVINVVRNSLISEFMESDCDALFMLDSDQALQKETFARMIDLGQSFVGCIYPKRALDWSKVNLAAARDMDEILYQASEYVGRLEEDETGKASVRNGFGLASFVGTGAVFLRREVFTRLMEAYPDLEGKGFGRHDFPGYSYNWGFFNSVIRHGIPLSEDVSFSVRWRDIGGQIWADIASPVMHVGQYANTGNYMDFLLARQRLREA